MCRGQCENAIYFYFYFRISVKWGRFGCHILLQSWMYKKKMHKLEAALPLISAFIPTLVIFMVKKDIPFHVDTWNNRSMWGILFATVFLTCLIKLFAQKREMENLPTACVEAAFMEIPQRAMMQTFVCMLLDIWDLNPMYGIVINAFIWVSDIMVQARIFGEADKKEIVIDAFASFVFSLGAGYVFWISDCILYTMLAHALERFFVARQKRPLE